MAAIPGPADVVGAVGGVVKDVLGAASDSGGGVSNDTLALIAGLLASSTHHQTVVLGRFKGALLAMNDQRWRAWINGVLNGTVTE